jgi:NADH:ubiquinone oxidoreductase subunit 6 (subunit J)
MAVYIFIQNMADFDYSIVISYWFVIEREDVNRNNTVKNESKGNLTTLTVGYHFITNYLLYFGVQVIPFLYVGSLYWAI